MKNIFKSVMLAVLFLCLIFIPACKEFDPLAVSEKSSELFLTDPDFFEEHVTLAFAEVIPWGSFDDVEHAYKNFTSDFDELPMGFIKVTITGYGSAYRPVTYDKRNQHGEMTTRTVAYSEYTATVEKLVYKINKNFPEVEKKEITILRDLYYYRTKDNVDTLVFSEKMCSL